MLTDRERHALRMLEFHTRVEDPKFARRLERPAARLGAHVRRLMPVGLSVLLAAACTLAVLSPTTPLGIVGFALAALSGGLLALTWWSGRRQRRVLRRWRRG